MELEGEAVFSLEVELAPDFTTPPVLYAEHLQNCIFAD
jgi:hypothetical protein